MNVLSTYPSLFILRNKAEPVSTYLSSLSRNHPVNVEMARSRATRAYSGQLLQGLKGSTSSLLGDHTRHCDRQSSFVDQIALRMITSEFGHAGFPKDLVET